MPLQKIPKRELKIFDIDEITIEQSTDKKESGTYGEIVFGIINDTGVLVALKRFKDDYSEQILDKDVTKEIIMLQLFNQFPETNTVQFYGIYISDDRENVYLVLERLETTLHNISIRVKHDDTKNRGRFNAEQYKIIFYKLLKSINAIHSLGFVHNDIKLANIMINNDDIKLIDFGLSKFIGLSPILDQVRDYDTTSVIKAPDHRISFSTDIFSLASTMVHLCLRDYRNLKVLNNKFIIDTFDSSELSFYLSMERTFDEEGHDLLLKLLDSNVEQRWCANKALLHPYFDSLRLLDNITIDRTLVGMKGGIVGLKHHSEYIDRIYAEKSLELCYFEEMYYNYKDMMCPSTQITTNINQYHILMNWILGKCNDGQAFQRNGIFYGIDTIVNGIIMTKNDLSSYMTTRKPKISPIIHPNYIYTTFNMMLYQDITVNKRPNFDYILNVDIDDEEIIELFYQYLIDINIDFYPISVHISYIYLQLAHELKTIRSDSKKTLQFNKNFFIDLCIQILIWFIQPIPFEKDITIWDIVVFSTIKLLSNILITSHITLIENPIIPVLTIDKIKYEEMLSYYKIQYKSMDFDTYKQYGIYFNKPLFT
jgi:serine/threonine protein kinase